MSNAEPNQEKNSRKTAEEFPVIESYSADYRSMSQSAGSSNPIPANESEKPKRPNPPKQQKKEKPATVTQPQEADPFEKEEKAKPVSSKKTQGTAQTSKTVRKQQTNKPKAAASKKTRQPAQTKRTIKPKAEKPQEGILIEKNAYEQDVPVYVEPPADNKYVADVDIIPDEEQPDDYEIVLTKGKSVQLKSVLQKSEVPKKRGRRRYGVAVGSFVLIFALVGVCFLATQIGQMIHRKATDDSELRGYDKLISAVVMQDPVPFESIDGANSEMIMTASLWRAILNAGVDSYNTYDDKGRRIIPLGAVDNACHELFGSDCQLQAKNPSKETFFEFNNTDNQFYVSPYSDQSSFAPYTESVKKSGNALILRVGYVSAVDEYRTTSAASKPVPVKYMEYVLKTDSKTGQKYIVAIRTLTN